MKKLKVRRFLTIGFLFTIFFIGSLVLAQDKWIENNFGPVYWLQPSNWLENPDNNEQIYGVYIGKLDENENLYDGCSFFIIVHENLEEGLIEEMLNDEDTVISSQTDILLDGFKGVLYKGNIRSEDALIDFSMMFFKGPIDEKQVAIAAFSVGKLGEAKRSDLEKILQSVKLKSSNQKSGLPETLKVSSSVLCKNVVDGRPDNPTDAFTFGDDKIYFWISLQPFKEKHSLLWEWYSPDKKLFASVPYALSSAKEAGEDLFEDYNVWSYLNINSINESLQGNWIVKFYIDGKLILTRPFKLTSQESQTEKTEIASSTLCKDVVDNKPVDITNTFTYDDERIYLWLSLNAFKDKQKVTWKWYSPDNQIYSETDFITPSAQEWDVEVIRDYYCWSWLYVDEIDKDLTGNWTVEVYLNDTKKLSKTFTLSEKSVNSDFKEIQLGDVSLKVPSDVDYFEDDENPGNYYILLNTSEDTFVFVGVEFSYENLIDEADFTYEGPWFTASVVEDTIYDEEKDVQNRFWYARLDSYTDTKGRYIYLFFFAPDDQFGDYKPMFKKIFDSLNLIVY